MIYNNKTVVFLYRFGYQDRITSTTPPYGFNNTILSEIKDLELWKTKIKSAYVNTIDKPNAVLYFGKTSKFPRYKIKDLKYKRCIKVDKSDYQVIGYLDYQIEKDLYVFEAKECYFVVFRLNSLEIFKSRSSNLNERIIYIEKEFGCKFIGVLNNCFTCSTDTFEDLTRIQNEEFSKCIKDEDFDEIINNHMEPLTKEDVDMLYDLLNSKDKESLGLGLQMLVGYNVTLTPCTVRLLLRNNDLKDCKNWNSVGVTQVKNSIHFKETGWGLKFKDYYAFDKNIKDLDKELSYYLWSKILIKYANDSLKDYNLPDLKFKCYAE